MTRYTSLEIYTSGLGVFAVWVVYLSYLVCVEVVVFC